MISQVASQLVNTPVYTQFYDAPLDPMKVTDQMRFNMKSRMGKLLNDMYIPAIASALEIHVQVVQDVHGYMSAVNTFPTHPTPATKKVILLWDNDKYYAAVNNLEHANLPIDEDEIPIAAHEMVTDFSCAMSQESNKGVSLVDTSDPGNLPITTVGDTVYAVV